jgi:prevent-host-death family protein
MTTVPLTEAKARLNELVDEAVRTHERVTITRHGRPAVVLLSVDDLEEIEETLFWSAEPDVLADVAAGRAESAAGTLIDERAVRRRYGVGRAG